MKGHFGHEPNMVFHLYKNRRGRHSKVKIWSYADLGTCRVTDLFMTNNDNELIPIELVDLIVKDMSLEEDQILDIEGNVVDEVTGDLVMTKEEREKVLNSVDVSQF